MPEYVSLRKFYYREDASVRDAAILVEREKRLKEESTFRTGIEIKTGELFLAVPKQLSILSERLFRVERKVSQLWHELPGIARWACLRGLIADEIMSSNEIEGVHSTRRQIQEALESAESKQPASEYKRFKEFAKLYLELTDKSYIYPRLPSDIRKIYDAVVAGELKESQYPDGELFRKDSVDIVSSTQKVIHRGVSPESAIMRMLEQMIALVDAPDIPPTFTAILSHFLLEYIHPFYDGNGRMGRYLLALYLSEPLSLPTVLSLSRVIAENKAKYYKAFEITQDRLNYGEATFFVIQVMEFIRMAQDDVIENLENKKKLLEIAEKSLNKFENEPFSLSDKEMKAMFIFAQYFLFGPFTETTLHDISDHIGISTRTARKLTRKLEEKGLLVSVSLKPLKFELTQKALTELDITDD